MDTLQMILLFSMGLLPIFAFWLGYNVGKDKTFLQKFPLSKYTHLLSPESSTSPKLKVLYRKRPTTQEEDNIEELEKDSPELKALREEVNKYPTHPTI